MTATPTRATGRTDPITLAAGDDFDQVDAGMYIDGAAPASIGDCVWYDGGTGTPANDENGIQDVGEPGIPGVVVNLNDDLGNLIATVQTDANGDYAFTGLAAGNYQVAFELPVGYTNYSPSGAGGDGALDSDANPSTGIAFVNLATGEVNNDIDAGMYAAGLGPIVLGDYVWLDASNDQLPNNGEGLGNVDVVLYDALGNELARVATDDTATLSANYLFTGVAQGDYRVAIDTSTLPAGIVQIADPDAVLDNETELLNQTVDNLAVDFGYEAAACDITIGGTVFLDYNQLLDNTVNGLDYIPAGINAVLVQVNGGSEEVVEVVSVPSQSEQNPGQYSFATGSCNQEYYVMLTVTTPAIGSTPPVNSSRPPTYVSTGEHIGDGVGSDGTVNGKSAVFDPSSVLSEEVNFGILRFIARTRS